MEKPGAGAVGCSDFFDGGGPGGGEAIGEVELLSDFSYRELAEWVVDFVYPNWGKPDWGGDFVAKYCGCRIAEVGVDELAGDYSMAEKGLAYCGGCDLVRLRGNEGTKKVRYGLPGGYRRGRRWMRHRTCSAKDGMSDFGAREIGNNLQQAHHPP